MELRGIPEVFKGAVAVAVDDLRFTNPTVAFKFIGSAKFISFTAEAIHTEFGELPPKPWSVYTHPDGQMTVLWNTGWLGGKGLQDSMWAKA